MKTRLSPEQLAAIRAGAEKYAPRQLELLGKFAAIDCGTGDREGNRRVVELVQEELSALPADVTLEEGPNGCHVVARIEPERPTGKIILNSHLDTVFHPGDTAAHPFRVEGDWAWGLGVADCKGGFAVSAYGVRVAWEAGLLPQKEIVMVYGCDEETGSPTARKVYRREAAGAEYAFVFEPGRGENGLVTQRKGCATIRLEVEGKAAHAGLNYQGGADASLELARLVTMLAEHNDPEKGIFFNAGRLRSGSHGDIVSDRAEGDVFFAFPSQADFQEVERLLAGVEAGPSATGCRVSAKAELLFPPMEEDEKSLRAYRLVEEAGRQLGMALPRQSSSGSSDACWFSSFGVPTVDALGPYMQDIHTVEERVRVSSIPERTQLFAALLATLCD